MMQRTPKSLRLHIGILGRRNVGKSSLLNAFTRQKVAIVSAVGGTTTDPIHKPMELLPLGPVLFIDTAGIDDEGLLGELRVQKTRRIIDRLDLAILVVAEKWGQIEENLLDELHHQGTPVVVVFNKTDQIPQSPPVIERLRELKIETVFTQAESGEGIPALREAILKTAPTSFFEERPILGDLVGPNGLAVLVVPIDKEAPKGRLIMPQVQSIRDLLDTNSMCMVVQERDLSVALSRLKGPPQLVVTDSQSFLKVAADTPKSVPMTSFSILFARYRGDLMTQADGTRAIEGLKPGDNVLIAEACSHHPIGDDIGRVKIPNWLNNYVGGQLNITTVQGHDFPHDLSPYRLVILCGSCTINRREVLGRIMRCQTAHIPVTNYGLTIAYSLGIFERALGPFPDVLEYLTMKKAGLNKHQVDHG